MKKFNMKDTLCFSLHLCLSLSLKSRQSNPSHLAVHYHFSAHPPPPSVSASLFRQGDVQRSVPPFAAHHLLLSFCVACITGGILFCLFVSSFVRCCRSSQFPLLSSPSVAPSHWRCCRNQRHTLTIENTPLLVRSSFTFPSLCSLFPAMAEWAEDYEDDYECSFEDELSFRSGVPSPSTPQADTSPASLHPPSTAFAPARGNEGPSLESSFQSYNSSSGNQGGGGGAEALFADSARGLSNPSSTLASSRHSDPTYPTEQRGAAATPNTRNVSEPQQKSLNEIQGNKSRDFYKSNYTVEKLDDAPLSQYEGNADPTAEDEELSSSASSEEESHTHLASIASAQHDTAPPPPPQQAVSTQPPPTSPHRHTPSNDLISSRASSSASSAVSETYSDDFTAVTSAAPPSAPPAPTTPDRSFESSIAASTPPVRTSLPALQPPRQSLPTLKKSFRSVESPPAPYSGVRPQQVLEQISRTLPSPSAASSAVSRRTSHRSNGSSSSSSDDDDDGAERARLLLLITDLQTDIIVWDRRIERKRTLMMTAVTPTPAAPPARQEAARRGRSDINESRTGLPPRRTSKAPPPAARAGGVRRTVSSGRGRGAGPRAVAGADGCAAGNGKGAPVTQARLDALREANTRLEAAYIRHGGDGNGAANIDVQTLVARADAQLQRARARLKEVAAARRALENRDKRAAHTIEAVHRRMPSTTELQDRQLNEGIYERTSLQRTVQELRANIERTRAATQLMESRCAELSTQVEQLHLSPISPKDFEALRKTCESRKKTVEKHRAAITVYSAAVGQRDTRGGASAAAGTPTSGGGYSGRTSRTTSPRKVSCGASPSALTTEEQKAIVDYEVAKAMQLAERQAELVNRKVELQSRIEDLQRQVQKRDTLIQANLSSGGGVYYVGGDRETPSVEIPPSLPAKAGGVAGAGSGFAAARETPLRHVLGSEPAKTANQRTSASPARSPHNAAATPTKDAGAVQREQRAVEARNSAAAERLRSAVAAARQNDKARQNESRAPPLDTLVPAEPPSSRTGTGQRIVRGAPPPSSSAFTALADSPRKASSGDRPRDTYEQHACRSPADDPIEEKISAGRRSPSQASESHVSALSAEVAMADDAEVGEDDGGIEAMLRKIDEDNRRIGEEVFGHASQQQHNAASPSPLSEHPEQQQNHGNGQGEGGADHGVGYGQNGEGAFGDVNRSGAPPVEEEELDEVLEEEVGEGSGRSTPEWLREI